MRDFGAGIGVKEGSQSLRFERQARTTTTHGEMLDSKISCLGRVIRGLTIDCSKLGYLAWLPSYSGLRISTFHDTLSS